MIDAKCLDDLTKIKDLVTKFQVVVIRGLKLGIEEQLRLTSLLGPLEPAWEDPHPDCDSLQLLDSRNQVKIDGKRSTNYWHVDRSFMPSPTRFSVLYALQIGSGARSTEFMDARALLMSLPLKTQQRCSGLRAKHDFAYRFPKIMQAKGYSEERVQQLRTKYPVSFHPLVRQSQFGASLYYSDLCVSGFASLPASDGKLLKKEIEEKIELSTTTFEHVWRPSDIVVWDNFSTMHRARPDGPTGLRVLQRSTAT